MTPAPRIRVAIVGGSGYGGGELLRLLLSHPRVEIATVTAYRSAGKPVSEIHRNLRGVTDLVFSGTSPAEAARGTEAVFVALPTEEAGAAAAEIVRSGVRVVDLSGAFRVRDAAEHKAFYGGDPPAPDLRPGFVYGLTEWARPKLREARAVANPGCFATAAELALLPLAEAGLLRGPVIVDGKTGSSGAGADPLPTTHHPARAQGFWTYKPLAHQHTPEIAQALRDAGAKDLDLTFVPHSAPMVRGIFATAYATVAADDGARVESLYRDRYAKEPFVRYVPGSPDVNVVAGSNFADVSVAVRGTRVVAFCALDNLVKGGAGQAVQNLNAMMGWPERQGLEFPGMMP